MSKNDPRDSSGQWTIRVISLCLELFLSTIISMLSGISLFIVMIVLLVITVTLGGLVYFGKKFFDNRENPPPIGDPLTSETPRPPVDMTPHQITVRYMINNTISKHHEVTYLNSDNVYSKVRQQFKELNWGNEIKICGRGKVDESATFASLKLTSSDILEIIPKK